MKQSFASKEFSSWTTRSRKTLILAALALLLVGCGGGGDDPAPSSRSTNTGSSGNSPVEQGVLNILCFVVSLGQSGCLDNDGVSAPDTSTTTTPIPNAPGCNGPDRCVPGSTSVYSTAYDIEPNNSIATASVASLPAAQNFERRLGFVANGTINNLTDGVDTYAFTAARSRTFGLQICAPTPPDICRNGSLDLSLAYFSVLDQFGNVLLSSQGDTVSGNYQQMHIDAGVLYYVMVLAEDTMNVDREYTLRVFETLTQPETEVLQEFDPNAPILSAGEAMSLTTTLDWIPPTMNEGGTPLAGLTGYNVYFGPESGIYLDFRHLDNPGLVTYVLDLPTSGSWFIAITALDSAGHESDFSNEVFLDAMCDCDLPPGDPGLMP